MCYLLRNQGSSRLVPQCQCALQERPRQVITRNFRYTSFKTTFVPGSEIQSNKSDVERTRSCEIDGGYVPFSLRPGILSNDLPWHPCSSSGLGGPSIHETKLSKKCNLLQNLNIYVKQCGVRFGLNQVVGLWTHWARGQVRVPTLTLSHTYEQDTHRINHSP